MKKSFMTRVLAVSLSAAMAFSMSSASNLMTASAASTVALKTTFKTLKVNQKYKLTLKNNTLNWKITKVTTSNKKICTVYGKTASSVMLKGKGVGRAKISVKVKTTKRKYPKNIKIMKCTANVKAATDQGQTTTFSATAAANSNTEVRVSFNQEIDAPEAANFAVSDGVTVSKAELSADKKSVLLTIAGAEYGKSYDLTVTGIKVAGKEQAEQKLTFVTPAATEKYPMTLEAKDKILKSDGQSQTLVTFTIKDENGNLITDKGVEVAFATSLGKFAEQRVSIQNGVATVMYTSEALMETQTAAITATVVESTDNQELMGLSTTSSITLTPNPDALNNTAIGAVITSVTAPTADRVIAYFNQKVEAKDFLTASGNVDKTKFTCTVKSGLDNGFEEPVDGAVKHQVVGILDVPTDDNALQLLVDRPMTDNTNIEVEFENKIKTNALISPKNKVYCKLADAHQPSVLDVKSEGLRTITVTFSEAVLPRYRATGNGTGTTAEQFSADFLANYAIDGIPLTDDRWQMGWKNPEQEGNTDSTDVNIKKISSKEDSTDSSNDKKGEIRIGSYQKGTDNRHIVTIKLGGDSYLPTGSHSLAISNVGDWAAKTDRERNIVNTQAFDFTVEDNDVIPTFEVEEQSPEQYLLKFNSTVVAVDQTFRTPDSSDYASSLQLQEQVGGSWVTISDNATASGKNPIRVSQVRDEKGNLTDEYVVEVRRDWTEVYNTASTRQNYFNKSLRLHVDANKLRNTSNNKLNAEINIPLNGTVMKNPDLESPVIGDVVQAEDTSGNPLESYNVTLSEPVKLSRTANEETLTPSQTQAAYANASSVNRNDQGVPMPSAQFISVDNGQTVDGIITDEVFIDAVDKTINIAPVSTLGAGKWRLAISSISDDYGNTASTVVHEIDVTRETATTNFRIVWAAVSSERLYPGFVSATHNNNNKGRYIFVKFNKPVQMAGNSVNAGVTGNYTINGATLPTGTQILANISGYDDHDGVTDSITIILPEGNFNTAGDVYTVDARNAMLNVSNAITSTSGETLTNGGMIRLPFQYGSATNTYGNANGSGTEDDFYNADGDRVLGEKSDAVWGNHPSERWEGGDNTFEDVKDYYQALKSALEDEKYRRVILSTDITLSNLKPVENSDAAKAISVFGRSRTLTINRAVDLDLDGHTINGNVVVSTTDAVDQISIYSRAIREAKIIGADNREGVAALTVNAGSAQHFILNGVTVDKGGANSLGNAININDTFNRSFQNKGKIIGDILITDANGAGFYNDPELGDLSQVDALKIDSNGEINLKGDLRALGELVVSQAVKKLAFGDGEACDIRGITIRVLVSESKVVFGSNVTATGATFISEAPNVKVQVEDSTTKDNMTWETNKGGTIVTVDKDNKEVSTGKIESVATGIQSTLNRLNVLNGSVNAKPVGEAKPDSADVPDTEVVTSSAISGTGLSLKTVKANIKQAVKDDLRDNFDLDVSLDDIDVSYRLESTNILQQDANDVITVKSGVSGNDSDIIRFRITYKDYSRTKNLQVYLNQKP